MRGGKEGSNSAFDSQHMVHDQWGHDISRDAVSKKCWIKKGG